MSGNQQPDSNALAAALQQFAQAGGDISLVLAAFTRNGTGANIGLCIPSLHQHKLTYWT
jgi:hypothetical protein